MPVLPRVPSYRHYRPKGLGVVRLDGRDIYLGPHGSEESVERYNRLIAEWPPRMLIVVISPTRSM